MTADFHDLLPDDTEPCTRACCRTRINPADVITEYAIQMTSGAMCIRSRKPHVERIYPLAQWITDEHGSGGAVWRRRVVVTQDWEEVTEP